MKDHELKGDVKDQGMTDTNTIGIKNTMVRRSEFLEAKSQSYSYQYKSKSRMPGTSDKSTDGTVLIFKSGTGQKLK
jgi:hypothetical protein